MEGFHIFLYICLGIALLSVAISVFLRRSRHERLISKMYAFLFLVSVLIILISLFIGGWEGMGYGFIGISIFLGSVIGLAVTILIRPMKQV
ncbi:YesK family protein [Lysinibacillus odysseyi]|uniref:YesK-like protein n=1 Tax=Lysinibacillus odysseyi 34hs-1 = NBRC 100172 TaxID=1220589 RepID=A0A0A3IJZ1_9BACI|nr:YesK family protein [Lysinibacillus odysseyi]KGR85069.1 hypothetical protein CD32_11545 [Lysinibacillus odysseyi 34hs-1 = NBRC 100172]